MVVSGGGNSNIYSVIKDTRNGSIHLVPEPQITAGVYMVLGAAGLNTGCFLPEMVQSPLCISFTFTSLQSSPKDSLRLSVSDFIVDRSFCLTDSTSAFLSQLGLVHLDPQFLKLVAWKVFGNRSEIEAFGNQLLIISRLPDMPEHMVHMRLSGESSLTCVVYGVWIPSSSVSMVL